MRLDGRRESSNVEDRRGMSTGAKAGIGGLGGIIMIALFTLLSGGNLGDVIGNVVQQGALGNRMHVSYRMLGSPSRLFALVDKSLRLIRGRRAASSGSGILEAWSGLAEAQGASWQAQNWGKMASMTA